jgi:hypothetical protein
VTEPPIASVAGTLDDTTVPAVGQASEGLPGAVAQGTSGLVTEVSADEPGGLPGLPGISGAPTAGSPVAADVIGGQSLQVVEDGALADAGEAATAPDMADFPMMGAGSATRPEEEERIRQAWLTEDDLWRLPVTLVPPVIDE